MDTLTHIEVAKVIGLLLAGLAVYSIPAGLLAGVVWALRRKRKALGWSVIAIVAAFCLAGPASILSTAYIFLVYVLAPLMLMVAVLPLVLLAVGMKRVFARDTVRGSFIGLIGILLLWTWVYASPIVVDAYVAFMAQFRDAIFNAVYEESGGGLGL